jgi:hypothetical protein
MTEPLQEFAKELAKQLPLKDAYSDALSPAAKQSSQLFTDIVKTVQLALAPLQLLGAYQDRLRDFIDNSVRRVPEEQRVSPPPQILGPILEGIQYEPEGTPIDQMFSELLSCSLDLRRVNEAHPAFPAIIKSLSVMGGAGLLVVARALGHSTTKMTEAHYAHLSPSFEASEIRRTAPRFGIAPDVVTPMRRGR